MRNATSGRAGASKPNISVVSWASIISKSGLLAGSLVAGGDAGSVVRLADGRSVELVDLRLADGALEITSRTLPPE